MAAGRRTLSELKNMIVFSHIPFFLRVAVTLPIPSSKPATHKQSLRDLLEIMLWCLGIILTSNHSKTSLP